jgi:hypothetical protein
MTSWMETPVDDSMYILLVCLGWRVTISCLLRLCVYTCVERCDDIFLYTCHSNSCPVTLCMVPLNRSILNI